MQDADVAHGNDRIGYVTNLGWVVRAAEVHNN